MTLASMLNQTITIYSKQTRSNDGRLSFSSGTNVKARFQSKLETQLLPDGTVLTILATAYVKPGITVNRDDKVTYASNDYKVYSKYPVPGMNGETDHIKLKLVKWLET